MKVTSERIPTQREQEIYQLVHVEGLTQAVVAAKYSLVQSTVSKICARVAEWRVTTRPGRGLTLVHQVWLALDEATQKAQQNRMLAAQAFRDSLKPHIAIITRTNKAGETTEERRLLRPKADYHMYDRMCQKDAEIVDLLRRAAEAESAARDLNRVTDTYREDHFARRGKRQCLDALKIARTLRQRGVAVPPAPRFLRREIEQYVRAKSREFPQSTKLHDFLPPDWQAFCQAMMSEPAVYVDALQANPEVAETFGLTPKPSVEYQETFEADIPPDNSVVTTEEEIEKPEVVAVCAAGEERKPVEQADAPARNNLASTAAAPKRQLTRDDPADDPFQFALPVLRVTSSLPGIHASDLPRQQRAKGS